MIFRSRFFLKDRLGETKTTRKFLWWPRSFGENKHWRWLCFATVKEQICEIDIGGSMQWGHYSYEWCEIAFVDETSPQEGGSECVSK